MRTRTALPLLLAALWLAGCHRPMRAPSPAVAEAQAEPVCRVGPDGAPPVSAMRVRETERGIGGTGAPALAERGIGGTGIGGTGIGGTGIVGVVTGFASLCVDGLEVALPAYAQVDIDGAAASVAALRAGQLALVGGTGDAGALTARAVSVRHEVTGPVGRVLEEGRRLLVAGQTVSVSDTTWRSGPVAVGDWIAVSGLPMPTGDIAATRIDRATPGRVRVHGLLVADGGRLRIGALTVRPPAGGAGATGYVRASGSYADGMLRADAITSDALATDPAAAFGGQVRRMILQAYVGTASGASSGAAAGGVGRAAGDRLRIGPAFEAAAQSGLTAAPVADLGIVELERSGPGDSFVATSLRDAPLPAALPLGGAPDGATYGGMPAPRGGGGPFVPAPVPASAPGIGIGTGPVNGPGGRPVPVPTTQPGFGGSLIPGLPPGTGGMMPPGFAGGFPGGPAGTVPGGVMGRPPH